MLAPYLSGLFCTQSDFGQPAGVVVGDMIVSDFFRFDFLQNLACGVDRNICTADAAVVIRVFAGNRD